MTNIISMGYEGQIFYGAPGSTAATQLLNTRDEKINLEPQYGNTTVRGAGTSPPVETVSVSSIKWGFTLNMTNASTDTALQALIAAAVAGTAVAFRLKDRVGGKGFDGDVNVKFDHGIPIKGEQTLDFSFEPNRDLRVPTLYI